MRFDLRLAGAMAAVLVVASTQPSRAEPTADPYSTIIVIGKRPETAAAGPDAIVIKPERMARLSTLTDLFSGAPGVITQDNFGGVDHPRLSIRGSGLQRGTQPAGRGVELRLNGLPMTYSDTSFDFVEWIEPLAFDRAVVLRGGRSALVDAAALGGSIDFLLSRGSDVEGALLRGETGKFRQERAQIALGGANETIDAFASGSWFARDGDRQFSAQSAARAVAGARIRLGEATRLRADALFSDSEIELPGPLTQAQIKAGAMTAQPGNLRGDWRRFVERSRIAIGIEREFGPVTADIAASRMATKVEFRRRDVQAEDNRDWAIAASLSGGENGLSWRLGYLGQRGDRRQLLFLNGGGTIPTFSGERGLQWADNNLAAARDTLSAGFSASPGRGLSIDAVIAYNRHRREIDDRFATRPDRPAAAFEKTYEAATGLLAARYRLAEDVEIVASLSRAQEPPTFDVLLVNETGLGAGAVLVNGSNPRRPVIVDLDDQTALTAELGAQGSIGPVRFDIAAYRGWLKGEIVSTTDPVSQTVASVGNADRSRRLGVEAFAEASLATSLTVSGAWTWTRARLSDDPRFGDNVLPIIPAHVLAAAIDYEAPAGYFAGVRLDWVPESGYADYANSVRADGYALLGARAGWRGKRVSVFVEGRNLTDENYVSTVIAAQNNLFGADAATFAPGEGPSLLFGIEARIGFD